MNDLVTSADGQWIVVRRDLTLTLHERGGGPAIATTMLDDASDVEIVAVGPPALFVVRAGTALAVFLPPTLECIAIAKLEAPMSMATVTGQRIAMLSADGKQLRLVRAAGRALAMHALDVGSPIEFAVGLDRNQVLFGLHRKLEVWDAASGRPLLRLQLQLPPAPRMIGAAHGHLWATKVGGDEVFIYRLSDGRPFRHPVGAPIERVIGHLGSQVIVVVTKNGLVRVHCLAHSVEMLELPDPSMRDHALGLLATTPDDVALVGCGDGVDAVPWRAPLSGLATTPEPEPAVARPAPIPTHTPLAALAQGGPAAPPATSSSLASGASATETEARIAIAAYGVALIAAARRELEPREAKEPRESRGLGLDGERRQPAHESRVIEPPSVDADSTIGSLVARLGLGPAARRALFALYGYHLNGERAAIAPLARGLGD
ncbi:MAG: hypothetical protein NT062_25845, partial [Proteobacteria bacterium]|nr:hypothetical protein [Pseudomonadota bacterium]